MAEVIADQIHATVDPVVGQSPGSNEENDDDLSEAKIRMKVTIKRWERAFLIQNGRKPGKSDLKVAPPDIQQAYKAFWKLTHQPTHHKNHISTAKEAHHVEDVVLEEKLVVRTSSNPSLAIPLSQLNANTNQSFVNMTALLKKSRHLQRPDLGLPEAPPGRSPGRGTGRAGVRRMRDGFAPRSANNQLLRNRGAPLARHHSGHQAGHGKQPTRRRSTDNPHVTESSTYFIKKLYKKSTTILARKEPHFSLFRHRKPLESTLAAVEVPDQYLVDTIEELTSRLPRLSDDEAPEEEETPLVDLPDLPKPPELEINEEKGTKRKSDELDTSSGAAAGQEAADGSKLPARKRPRKSAAPVRRKKAKENFVRLEMKKKIYQRGKKQFNSRKWKRDNYYNERRAAWDEKREQQNQWADLKKQANISLGPADGEADPQALLQKLELPLPSCFTESDFEDPIYDQIIESSSNHSGSTLQNLSLSAVAVESDSRPSSRPLQTIAFELLEEDKEPERSSSSSAQHDDVTEPMYGSDFGICSAVSNALRLLSSED